MSEKPDMTSDTPMDKAEAARALADADQSEKRSSAFFAYRYNAPMLMLWGVMWAGADLTMAYAPWPAAQAWAWPVASTLGGLLSIAYWWRFSSNRVRASGSSRSRVHFWRMMAIWAFNAVFIVSVMYIFAPFKWREPHAFWGMLIAFVYCCFGVWNGWRLTALGVALGAGTLYAFYVLPDAAYLPFMGLACGGGLVLGGIWLRTA